MSVVERLRAWGNPAATGAAPPAQVTGLTALPASASEIDLSWDGLSPAPDTYRIEESTDGGSTFTEVDSVAGSVTTYARTGRTEAAIYHYRVRARTGGLNGTYSATQHSSPALWGILNHQEFEASGDLGKDSSPAYNPFLLSGSPTQVAGDLSQAMELTGGQYCTAAYDDDFAALGTGLTVRARCKRLSNNDRVVAARWTYQTAGVWAWEYDGGASGPWGFYVAPTANDGLTAYGQYTAPGIGVWGTATWIYDGTLTGNANRLKAVQDGTQKTITFTGTLPAALQNAAGVPTYIGRWGGTLTQYADKDIEYLTIWNRPVPVATIQWLDSGNGGKGYTWADLSSWAPTRVGPALAASIVPAGASYHDTPILMGLADPAFRPQGSFSTYCQIKWIGDQTPYDGQHHHAFGTGAPGLGEGGTQQFWALHDQFNCFVGNAAPDALGYTEVRTDQAPDTLVRSPSIDVWSQCVYAFRLSDHLERIWADHGMRDYTYGEASIGGTNGQPAYFGTAPYSPLWVGQNLRLGNETSKCAVAVVACFDAELTQAQIAWLYNSGRGRTWAAVSAYNPTLAALKRYWYEWQHSTGWMVEVDGAAPALKPNTFTNYAGSGAFPFGTVPETAGIGA